MSKGLYKFCIFGMPLVFAFFTVGVLLSGDLPPPTPLRDAGELSTYLGDHATRIRVGLVICALGCGFAMPYAAVVARETQKMTDGGVVSRPGRNVHADIQLIGTVLFGFAIFIPILMFMGALFNPLNNPDVTKGIYDMAFIILVAPVSFGSIWVLFLGVAMLADKQPVATFPRWFAYFTLFTGFDFLGGGFCVLTKTGPFAWNGVISFYIPFVTLGAWLVGMTVFLLRAADLEYGDDGQLVGAPGEREAVSAPATA